MNQQLVKNSVVMSSFVCKWLSFYSRLPMLYSILLDITKYGHENRPFWETIQKININAKSLPFKFSKVNHKVLPVWKFCLLVFKIIIQCIIRSRISYKWGALGKFLQYQKEIPLHVLIHLKELVKEGGISAYPDVK